MEPRKNKKRSFFEEFFEEEPFLDEYVSRIEERMARILEDAETEVKGEAYVYGFSMTQDAEGKPVITEFGNAPEKSEEKKSNRKKISENTEREPLIDVIEDAGEIRVIAEVTGFEKGDIVIDAKSTRLAIAADRDGRRYRKEIDLPSEIDTSDIGTAYNNGVLEITAKKIKKGGNQNED